MLALADHRDKAEIIRVIELIGEVARQDGYTLLGGVFGTLLISPGEMAIWTELPLCASGADTHNYPDGKRNDYR